MVSTGRIESVFTEIHSAIDVIEINPNERIAFRQGRSHLEDPVDTRRLGQGEIRTCLYRITVIRAEFPFLVEEIIAGIVFLPAHTHQHAISVAIETIDLIVGKVVAKKFLCENLSRNIFVGPLPVSRIDVEAHGLGKFIFSLPEIESRLVAANHHSGIPPAVGSLQHELIGQLRDVYVINIVPHSQDTSHVLLTQLARDDIFHCQFVYHIGEFPVALMQFQPLQFLIHRPWMLQVEPPSHCKIELQTQVLLVGEK